MDVEYLHLVTNTTYMLKLINHYTIILLLYYYTTAILLYIFYIVANRPWWSALHTLGAVIYV